EISFYQGYLDSAQAAKYTQSVVNAYPFVERIIFFDTEISNHFIPDGIRANNLAIGPKAVYQFGKNVPPDSVILFHRYVPEAYFSLKTGDEFNKMAIKFSGFIEQKDTTT